MRATIKNADELPFMLTVAQAQAVYGCSKKLMYDTVHRKDFPAIRLGRTIRIPRDAFLQWIEQQATGSNGAR